MGLTDDLMSVPDAARQLSVSTSTVWRWIRSGGLKAYRIGPKRVMLRASDLSQTLRPSHVEQRDIITDVSRVPHYLSEQDTQRLRAAIANSRRIHERMRKFGPLAPSWELISEARDQRSRELRERHQL